MRASSSAVLAGNELIDRPNLLQSSQTEKSLCIEREGERPQKLRSSLRSQSLGGAGTEARAT